MMNFIEIEMRDLFFLLLDRYFELDFFVCDIFDVMLKFDMVLMVYLFFILLIKLDYCI